MTFKGMNFRLKIECARKHKNQYGLAHTPFSKISSQNVTKKNHALTREKPTPKTTRTKKPLDQ